MTMQMRPAASVSERPRITLERWAVYETERSEHHFVGYSLETRSGRVSSAIVSYDSKTQTGVTRSGRLYVLTGPPSIDEDAEYVWACWSLLNGVLAAKDVSETYLKGSSR